MKTIIYIVLALAISSCKEDKNPDVKTAPAYLEEAQAAAAIGDLNETSETIEVTFQDEKMTSIYEGYLELKAALVNTNADDAADVATEFSELLAVVAGDDNESFLALHNDVKAVAVSKDVKQQRVLFQNISNEVEILIKPAISEGQVIKQYCPMAFDGKGGYWLSDSREIRNPYFGDVMLKCGVVDSDIE